MYCCLKTQAKRFIRINSNSFFSSSKYTQKPEIFYYMYYDYIIHLLQSIFYYNFILWSIWFSFYFPWCHSNNYKPYNALFKLWFCKLQFVYCNKSNICIWLYTRTILLSYMCILSIYMYMYNIKKYHYSYKYSKITHKNLYLAQDNVGDDQYIRWMWKNLHHLYF